ncbi:MAG TPA: lipoprotein [Vicinamibacterales bacterium]|nr:lipoprotein [Vicinamibacterales bacterium]
MSGRLARLGITGAVVLAAVSACGRKGPPLPPLRPVPGHVTDLAATRVDDRVTLTFTIPRANRDGSTPSAVQHVEIYVVETAASAPVPTPEKVIEADRLLTSVDVRPADAVRAPGDPPDPRPGPGEQARFVDVLSGRPIGVADAPTRHYVAIGVTGNRRGAPSLVTSVPLSKTPDVLRAGNRE